jgi:hypothetical protein
MRFNRTRGVLMGRDADASSTSLHDACRNHCGGRGVKMTRLATGAQRWPPRGNKTRSSASSQAAARWLVADGRAALWSRLVPRRSGKLCETQPRRLGKPSRTKNPGTSMRKSKTSARRGTRRSPMLAHETSPVSGASVVGMTYGAHHGPGNMPDGVPGVPTASAREDRLRPKGRLRQ